MRNCVLLIRQSRLGKELQKIYLKNAAENIIKVDMGSITQKKLSIFWMVFIQISQSSYAVDSPIHPYPTLTDTKHYQRFSLNNGHNKTC